MNIQDINTANMNAMRNKDSVARALFSTLKGNIENEMKAGGKSETEIIQKLAKKYTENALVMNTEDSLKEVELLKPFMPQVLENQNLDVIINNVIKNNLELCEQFQADNKQIAGRLVGLVMKQAKTDWPGYVIDSDHIKTSLELVLNS
jgi:uncharacterized protein YqeY